MGITRRAKLTSFSVLITILILVAIFVDTIFLTEIKQANNRITNKTPRSSEFVEERFALAKIYLTREQKDMALRILNDISQDKFSDEIKAKALFNSANIYFRTAVEAREDFKEELIVPNLELAKMTYRKALELQPSHRGSRYNLERALQMAPEKNFTVSDDSIRPERGERAVTTMKLQAIGMP